MMTGFAIISYSGAVEREGWQVNHSEIFALQQVYWA